MLSMILADVRLACRGMRRQPAFTAVVIGTLALGIAATTAMFGLVHAALLKPLPYKDPDRLVLARRTFRGQLMMWNSPADYYDYRAQTPGFETLAATWSMANDLWVSTGGRPEAVRALQVTYDLFPMLGVKPVAGRFFTVDEAVAGAPHVVIVNARVAEHYFGTARAAVGKTLAVSRSRLPATIVGVLPSTFRFFDTADMWTLLRRGEGDAPTLRRNHNIVLFGRLKAGVSLAAVQRQIDVVSRRLQLQYPESNKQKGLRVDALQAGLLAQQTPMLMLLMGAVTLVLLIACANVAGMLLTRGVSRRPELAVRAALGASRGRIAAQLVTESLLLSLVAGAAGLVLAAWFRRLLIVPTGLVAAGVNPAGIETNVLVFALGISLATGLLSGVAPALRAASGRLAERLAPGTRATEAPGGSRIRALLVTSQIALSLVLLAGAGLLFKSLVGLMTTDLKFRTDHLMAASVEMPRGAEPRLQFQRLVRDDLAALPGVTDVTITSHMPVLEPWQDPIMWPSDRPPADPSERRSALIRWVMPGYFKTLGIRMQSGRDLSPDDRLASTLVMVVNEAFVRQFFPGRDPVGRRIMMMEGEAPREYVIVGVVDSARTDGVIGEPRAAAYVSANQVPLGRARVIVRSMLGPNELSRALRKVVAARNPDMAVGPVLSLDSLLFESLASPRVNALTIGGFSILALLLAALGLYGVLAHHVAQRTHEIGVRVALGAGSRSIVMTVLRHSAWMVGPGLVVGLLGALACTKILTRFLYGVRPADPATLIAVTVLLALVGMVASAWPAWRATRVDPVRALRGE